MLQSSEEEREKEFSYSMKIISSLCYFCAEKIIPTFSSRIFWFCCILASWVGSSFLISSFWKNFEYKAISFGTDTTYLNWNTTFFSVSVCEAQNDDKIYDYVASFLGETHNYNYDEVIKEVVYFEGKAPFTKEYCFNEYEDINCPKTDIKKLVEPLRDNCSTMFESCSWMGIAFSCCEYFLPLETEMGSCFTINSQQIKNAKILPMVSNLKTGPGSLLLKFKSATNIYIHAQEDVPHLSTQQSEIVAAIYPGYLIVRQYSILEIENEEEVKDISVDQRRCRYPEENYLKAYDYYSYTACIVECRTQKMIELCNCTSHFSPRANDSIICDLQGLVCLYDNLRNFAVVINPWSTGLGLICSCLPGCSEPEYDVIEEEYIEGGTDWESYAVELALHKLPSERFKRNVVYGKLDLVVSIGGTIGLFVGASLLSFVEFFYFFIFRFYQALKKNCDKTKASSERNESKTKLFTISYPRRSLHYPLGYQY